MNILFYNGKVLTQDVSQPFADTVYIKGNKIEYVGNKSNQNFKIAKDTITIDLKGKILLSGFIDTHTHFVNYALSKDRVDLSETKSMDDVRQKLLEFKQIITPDIKWISGIGWNQNIWPDSKGFNRYFIDDIFPDIPVFLANKDRHSFLCNSEALEKMGINKNSENPAGGKIGFFPDGTPDGFLYENAWKLIDNIRPELPFEIQEKLLKEAISEAYSLGLTGIHSMEGERAYKLFSSLLNKDELKMRVCWHFPLELLDEMIANGIKSYTGDDWLKFGGVKLFMDGSLGSQTAYMFHPYLKSKDNYGILIRSEDDFYDLIVKAGRNGISTSTHSIGDRSNNIVINAIIKANRNQGLADKKLLHRIEHCQCIIPSDQKRVADKKIFCSMQPIHISLDAKIAEKYWGKYERNSYPFRSLLDYGAKIGFGSDVPIETHNPFLGIYSAIERKYQNNPDNPTWMPEQKITIEEAIKAYTLWAAYSSKNDDKIGSITKGKLADLIVIDDYTKHDSSFWINARPYMTVIDGEIVYNNLI
ncbi:MAG: amidohydrolase [Candidatus Cloacimonadota bacterium]|nr:amidohydrolase [Candidatus Cloacimonadota bacterium]